MPESLLTLLSEEENKIEIENREQATRNQPTTREPTNRIRTTNNIPNLATNLDLENDRTETLKIAGAWIDPERQNLIESRTRNGTHEIATTRSATNRYHHHHHNNNNE